jgi:hypothetical protein
LKFNGCLSFMIAVCGTVVATCWALPNHWLRNALISHPAEFSVDRFFDIRSAVISAREPIIVFGDSIVEGAVLPPIRCGHDVVNGGVVGAGIEYFDHYADGMMTSARPSLIVLAVGINDAAKELSDDSVRRFQLTYEATIQKLMRRAPVAITTITPIKSGRLSHFYNPALASILNNIIMAMPAANVINVTQPLLNSNLTSDGIHLKAEGYAIWTKAIMDGVDQTLGCSP